LNTKKKKKKTYNEKETRIQNEFLIYLTCTGGTVIDLAIHMAIHLPRWKKKAKV
jgi:hypothetical protein